MKLKMICLAVTLLSAEHVCAQGSVTISGLLDAGVSYVSNQGGSHTFKFDDGIPVPNLLILKGKEDLGDGNSAVFELTNQFVLGNGETTPGQGLFGRTALVGLDSAHLGRLTLGNQYDFMFDSLLFGLDDAAFYTLGIYDFRNGPFTKLGLPNNPTGAFDWDRVSGQRVQNSVKYTSPTYHGFSAGVLYGFGNVAGSVGAGNTASVGLNYGNAAFGVNAAYTNVKTILPTGQVSVRNWGVGTHADFGKLTTTALLTTVHNSLNGASVWQIEVGALYPIGPLHISGGYSYMKGNDVVDNNHAHQVTGMLTYLLSKRTSVYAAAVYQRTNAGANAQINSIMVPSSSASQLIARVGMQTRF